MSQRETMYRNVRIRKQTGALQKRDSHALDMHTQALVPDTGDRGVAHEPITI